MGEAEKDSEKQKMEQSDRDIPYMGYSGFFQFIGRGKQSYRREEVLW